MASQQILGLSCADSGNALFWRKGSICCLVSLCYLPLSPTSSSTPAPPLGRLINARLRLHLGALEMQSVPPLGRFRNARRRPHLNALEMQSAPPLGRLINAWPRLHLGALEMQGTPSVGRFRNAKPRLRLGALEMQGRASAWTHPKCKHAPLSSWTSPRVAKDRWSHPGPLVTSPGDPQAPRSFVCLCLGCP